MNPPPRFLFDECLSRPAVAELTTIKQIQSASLVDLLGRQGALDSEWIPRIAAEGRWVVITADGGKQRSRGGKLPRICREQGVTHVIVSSKIHAMRTQEKLEILLKVWDQIERVAEAPPGTRFKLRFRPAKGSGLLRIVLERVPDDRT